MLILKRGLKRKSRSGVIFECFLRRIFSNKTIFVWGYTDAYNFYINRVFHPGFFWLTVLNQITKITGLGCL